MDNKVIKYEDIAKMIDHSLLDPSLTINEVIEGCKLAVDYRVASVCVRPSDVVLAKEILSDSDVLTTTVIGFPHGTTTTVTKVFEASEAIKNGVAELDIVLNIGRLKSNDLDFVREDIKSVTEVIHKNNMIIKVIFENCFLNKSQKIDACRICNELGVDYIKTSTGYGTGGARNEDLILMRKYAKPEIKIKAAGGVRTLERAIEVKELGCSRFGATATVKILERLK